MIWSKMVAKVVNETRTEDGPGAGQPLGVCAWFAVAAQVVEREISAAFRCPEPCGLAGSQGLSLE